MVTERFDVQRHVLGPLLTYGLSCWSANVFRPAQVMKSLGLYRPNTLGQPPAPRRLAGGGPGVSRTLAAPLLLDKPPGHYDSVVEFDHCSEDYQAAVKPFSQPVFDELVGLLLNHLVPDARILDPSCGPGIEAITLARLVPDGEVVAADLSRGMVETAWRDARNAGVSNMAFVQADVGASAGSVRRLLRRYLMLPRFPPLSRRWRGSARIPPHAAAGRHGLRRRPGAQVVQ